MTADLAYTVQRFILVELGGRGICMGVPKAARHNSHGLPLFLAQCDLQPGQARLLQPGEQHWREGAQPCKLAGLCAEALLCKEGGRGRRWTAPGIVDRHLDRMISGARQGLSSAAEEQPSSTAADSTAVWAFRTNRQQTKQSSKRCRGLPQQGKPLCISFNAGCPPTLTGPVMHEQPN